jgi:hypothetical protein
MALAGLFIDDSSVTADLYGLTAVTLLGRYEFDAAVGKEDQRLLPFLADLLSDASLAYQIRCNGGILTFIHIPGHDLAAPYVDHQVEVQPDSPHGGWQVRDVPTQHLIGFCGP